MIGLLRPARGNRACIAFRGRQLDNIGALLWPTSYHRVQPVVPLLTSV